MKNLILTATGVALLASTPALAHHSFAMFDQTKELTLVGTVREFQWTNPHSWIQLTVRDSAGKTAECGGLCAVSPREGGVMMRVGADHFDMEPLRATNRCTPGSISAHMLYENSDPFLLHEPGGVLDVTPIAATSDGAPR